MGFFLNAQETIFRYGEYMEQFQDAFKSNDRSFGSPENFFRLSEDLTVDTPLRAQLARLTYALLAKENNKISLRTVLTVIAISSGGPDITASNHDTSKPLNNLIDFLTNAVGCRQLDLSKPDTMWLATSIPDSIEDFETAFGTQQPTSVSASEKPANHAPAGRQSTPTATLNGAAPPPLSADHSDEFKQLFTRLELTSLEVKLHLDSIDKRISRMEPRLEAVPPLTAPIAERYQRADHLHRQETSHPAMTATALAEPEPPPGELLLHGIEVRGIPLQSYDDPQPFFLSGFKVVVIFVLLGLAISAGVLLYLHRSDEYISQSYQYIRERLSALRQSYTTPSTTDAPANAPSENADAEPVANSMSAPLPAPPTETPDNLAPQDSPQMRPQPAIPESLPPFTPTVEVTSNAMASNLISAPKPIYPKLAQQNHTQGKVVLQGTVSSNGSVEDLHGLKGPRILQDAAIDAVTNWHYRPHLVDGHPMPVAIIITIDFTLPPDAQAQNLTPSP